MTESTTYPGRHEQVDFQLSQCDFSSDEREIVNKLEKEWYVTRVGQVQLGTRSKYKYIFIKPTKTYQEMFNLERELAVVLSSYESFEPRTLDAFEQILKENQKLRLEKICYILLSRDNEIEIKIGDVLKQIQESQIIVPISFKEFLGRTDNYYLRNKFKRFFYTRDLFAFESPLRKDLYFFGRTDLIHKIVSRHQTGENSGLFGLRKTGKTSVIYGIERVLKTLNENVILIDCQNTGFHKRRWNEALYYVIWRISEEYQLEYTLVQEVLYTEKDASIIFESEIKSISKALGGRIMLIFDEIENITFGISPSIHWERGLDFIYFWQTIRSIFQKDNTIFTFLIVGTNPIGIEKPTINSKDNPIYNFIPYEYIERFDVPQTREMVRKLGRVMGLKFEEVIYAKLTEDYGGHPFLIRHVCSLIHEMNEGDRPVQIDRLKYEAAKKEFDIKYQNYIEMILNVLSDFYPDEYKMLSLLAVGNKEEFEKLAAQSSYYTNHLKGYGIISQIGGVYDFRIDSVKEFLIEKNRYQKIDLTTEEKLSEISARRNHIEPKLRRIVRNQLRASLGETDATDTVLKIYGEPRKSRYASLSYAELFDGNRCEVYFEDLRKLISKYWDYFKNFFDRDQEAFNLNMKAINKYRSDAHAKDISDEEMMHFRVCMKWLEEKVKDLYE